jgi:hypothetical protein
MTLDFYAGTYGNWLCTEFLVLPIDIGIYELKTFKYLPESLKLIILKLRGDNRAFTKVMQKLLLSFFEQNVPVISPLSKDVGNPFNSLYQTILVKL